jgi:hypothetical protein
MNTIQNLIPGLHPEQLAAIEAQMLTYYRANLIREIERLSPTALIQVSSIVASINELDFLLQVENTPESEPEPEQDQRQQEQESTPAVEETMQAPEEQQEPQPFNLLVPTCQGCVESLDNQMAHMNIGGCLAFPILSSIFD